MKTISRTSPARKGPTSSGRPREGGWVRGGRLIGTGVKSGLGGGQVSARSAPGPVPRPAAAVEHQAPGRLASSGRPRRVERAQVDEGLGDPAAPFGPRPRPAGLTRKASTTSFHQTVWAFGGAVAREDAPGCIRPRRGRPPGRRPGRQVLEEALGAVRVHGSLADCALWHSASASCATMARAPGSQGC